MLNKFKNFLVKFNSSINKINKIDRCILLSIKKDRLECQHNICKENLTTGNCYHVEGDLIVSITTYGRRVHQVYLTLESIANQTCKPNKVILWLDENEFSKDSLPLSLKKLCKRGLIVRFCPNYKSYKKLVPSIMSFPHDTIVTIDDDILYPQDFLENLIGFSEKNKGEIVGYRAHEVTFNGNLLNSYKNWRFEQDIIKDVKNTFLTTGAGTLFPPRVFNYEFVNSDVFMDKCPDADDIWVYVMAKINGVTCRRVNDIRPYWDRFLLINDTGETGLYVTNVDGGGNDRQLKDVVDHYDVDLK